MKLALAAFALLSGCAPPEGVDLGVITDPHPAGHTSDSFAIGEGSAVAVTPSTWRGEIEGSSVFPVDDIRAEDPAVVGVERAARTYAVDGPGSGTEHAIVLVGLTRGHTVLHFLREGDDAGTYAVDVVAQDP